MAQIRKQAIIWTNDATICSCIYALLGLDGGRLLISACNNWVWMTRTLCVKTIKMFLTINMYPIKLRVYYLCCSLYLLLWWRLCLGYHSNLVVCNLQCKHIAFWGTHCSEILIEIHIFLFNKMHLKMSSAKLRPFYLSLNVLRLSVLFTVLYDLKKGNHHTLLWIALWVHTWFACQDNRILCW